MKILIVDDEPLVRKSLGRACKSKGHEVFEAADGLEGLRRWEEVAPDLVFLDILMPGLSGPEVLKQVRAQRDGAPDLPMRQARVILMSAYSGEHSALDVEMAQQMGADLFIPKPFEDVFAVVGRGETLLATAGPRPLGLR